MKLRSILKTLAVLLLIGGGVLFINLVAPSAHREPEDRANSFALSVPPFGRAAHAAPVCQFTASFLDDEAGIAAYTQVAGRIDLSLVRDEFRTKERETSEYIVGSVGIPDYSEEHDPHVYVDTDGWVLAYYLAHEPASHIMDLRHYDGVTIANTKLENAMNEILVVLGEVPFTAAYYDFRYPDATHIMLIAEANYGYGDDSFDVQLPNDFVYYERSWAHAQYDEEFGASTSIVYVDEVLISELRIYLGWLFDHGILRPAQLAPGASHAIRLHHMNWEGEAFCGLALVYQEVP